MDDEKITKKELFEKIIEVKTKIDLLDDRGKRTNHTFTLYVYLIFLLQIINIFIHAWGLWFPAPH